MKRRDFVESVSRIVGLSVSANLGGFQSTIRLSENPSLLIPMDDVQGDHLKAYGVAYRVVQAGIKARGLLNYRGGGFLGPAGGASHPSGAPDGRGRSGA